MGNQYLYLREAFDLALSDTRSVMVGAIAGCKGGHATVESVSFARHQMVGGLSSYTDDKD